MATRRGFLGATGVVFAGCLDIGDAGNDEENESETTEDEVSLVLEVRRIDEVPGTAEAVELGDEPIPDSSEIYDDFRTAIEDAREEEREARDELGRGLDEDERPVGASPTTPEATETINEMPEYDGEHFSPERYVRYESEVYAFRILELL